MENHQEGLDIVGWRFKSFLIIGFLKKQKQGIKMTVVYEVIHVGENPPLLKSQCE